MTEDYKGLRTVTWGEKSRNINKKGTVNLIYPLNTSSKVTVVDITRYIETLEKKPIITIFGIPGAGKSTIINGARKAGNNKNLLYWRFIIKEQMSVNELFEQMACLLGCRHLLRQSDFDLSQKEDFSFMEIDALYRVDAFIHIDDAQFLFYNDGFRDPGIKRLLLAIIDYYPGTKIIMESRLAPPADIFPDNYHQAFHIHGILKENVLSYFKQPFSNNPDVEWRFEESDEKAILENLKCLRHMEFFNPTAMVLFANASVKSNLSLVKLLENAAEKHKIIDEIEKRLFQTLDSLSPQSIDKNLKPIIDMYREDTPYLLAENLSLYIEKLLKSNTEGMGDVAADYFEEKLREAVSNRKDDEGREYLIEALTKDPERKRRLTEEFGFIYDLQKSPGEDKEIRNQKEGQIEWRRRVWQIMTQNNKDDQVSRSTEKKTGDKTRELSNKDEDSKNKETTESPVKQKNIQYKTSDEKGKALEKAGLEVFKSFLERCGTFEITDARKLNSGSQSGHDLKIFCERKDSGSKLRLLVECKNYSKYVEKKDIAEKLLEVESYHQNIPIDHWILISPNANVKNDVDNLLETWEENRGYKFKVQFWTPSKGVKEFFGLFPEVYDQIIEEPGISQHPREWEEEKRIKVIDSWKAKLKPPVRLPKGWEQYNMKVIITSRKHFFENQTEKEKLLSRIGNPQLLHLAPVDRGTVKEYLREYAKNIGEEEKYRKLVECHDPIGLAQKVLFLDMVQTSLKDLPENDFNEFILYETYIKNSLKRKIEDNEDEDLNTSEEQLINNLKTILEDVALVLYETNKPFVYLSEIPNSGLLAKRLWKIINDNDKTKEDAGTRLSTRSLLKPMVEKSSTEDKRWPVDFCHRSMREYFTAKKICKMIQLDDLSDAEQILRLYKLSYEILYFASQIMKNTGFNYEENLLKLIDKSRYEDDRCTDISGRLGGNAVNLLYRYKGKLPQDFNWRNLVLNDAELGEADLSGMDFSNTYFMSANLDNVNLENANFTKANLSLVRIEETSPVYGIAISPEEEIYAYYEDGVIRAWDYQPGKKPNAISFTENKDKKDITFFAYPGKALTVLDGNRIIFYDRAESKLEQKSIFEISQDQKIISVSEGYLLIGEERKALNMTELLLYNLTSQKVVNRQYVPREAICDHIGDNGFIVSDEKNGLRIIWQIDEVEQEIKIPIDNGSLITCLATYPCKPPLQEYRLGIGMNNGNIEVWRIKLPQREPVKLLKNSHNSHDGKIVKDIAFIDENRVISGGFDKKVVCLSFNPGGDIICEPEEFIMRLRCKGMKVDGMEREHERKLFENFISRAT